ncbi:MAG: hypothetical protein KGH64_01105 [Candidatus Micrarchaeota archaeon]|nr:hypothetical protein [Candidatus Micrarchaeota archaeon]MDE1833915.1 hypothetical protein [Candidatus Micrarchaeota archaeon]MDE1859484.1 hypothetical protein [Candidatus Micrarchaeota archaeon]
MRKFVAGTAIAASFAMGGSALAEAQVGGSHAPKEKQTFSVSAIADQYDYGTFSISTSTTSGGNHNYRIEFLDNYRVTSTTRFSEVGKNQTFFYLYNAVNLNPADKDGVIVQLMRGNKVVEANSAPIAPMQITNSGTVFNIQRGNLITYAGFNVQLLGSQGVVPAPAVPALGIPASAVNAFATVGIMQANAVPTISSNGVITFPSFSSFEVPVDYYVRQAKGNTLLILRILQATDLGATIGFASGQIPVPTTAPGNLLPKGEWTGAGRVGSDTNPVTVDSDNFPWQQSNLNRTLNNSISFWSGFKGTESKGAYFEYADGSREVYMTPKDMSPNLIRIKLGINPSCQGLYTDCSMILRP